LRADPAENNLIGSADIHVLIAYTLLSSTEQAQIANRTYLAIRAMRFANRHKSMIVLPAMRIFNRFY
jgi:hypothetical protein